MDMPVKKELSEFNHFGLCICIKSHTPAFPFVPHTTKILEAGLVTTSVNQIQTDQTDLLSCEQSVRRSLVLTLNQVKCVTLKGAKPSHALFTG